MAKTTLTGRDLEQALKQGKLSQKGAVLTGMAKPSEKDGHIAFTRSGCDAWIDLPTELIEQAEHVGNQTCKDHMHPVVRITLKDSESPEGLLLASLLAQEATGTSAVAIPGSPRGQAVPGFANPPRGRRGGPGMAPPNPTFRPSSRLGGGGIGPEGGGLNDWCWTGSCCVAGHYEAGPAGWYWVCDLYEDCEWCIWTPW